MGSRGARLREHGDVCGQQHGDLFPTWLHPPPLPNTGWPQAGSSNIPADIVLGTKNIDFVEICGHVHRRAALGTYRAPEQPEHGRGPRRRSDPLSRNRGSPRSACPVWKVCGVWASEPLRWRLRCSLAAMAACCSPWPKARLAGGPGTSFGWDRPLGHLKDERLWWLPDAPVLK